MHSNQARTAVLFGLPSAVAVLLGTFWGWPGVGAALVAVTAVSVYVWWRSASVALRAMRSYPVTEAERPELYRLVRELSARARAPMPRIYVSPTRAATAFAVGRTPARAGLCCTEGLLALLDERELRAVIAHELSHVRNRDTLPSSTAGSAASLALVAFLPPVAATIVRLATAPGREYGADADAARITGDPLALAAALRKLDASTRRLVLPPERDIVAVSHAMIAPPLEYRGNARLFATHPPMAERVARLEQLAGYRR